MRGAIMNNVSGWRDQPEVAAQGRTVRPSGRGGGRRSATVPIRDDSFDHTRTGRGNRSSRFTAVLSWVFATPGKVVVVYSPSAMERRARGAWCGIFVIGRRSEAGVGRHACRSVLRDYAWKWTLPARDRSQVARQLPLGMSQWLHVVGHQTGGIKGLRKKRRGKWPRKAGQMNSQVSPKGGDASAALSHSRKMI